MPGIPRKGLELGDDYTEKDGKLFCTKCEKFFPHNRFYNLKGIFLRK